MYRCGICERVASAETWLRRVRANQRWLAPVTIICSGTYWRNAWKYQARTYRHFGWDNGTLLANVLAVSAASGLPAKLVLGFVDAEANRLLDLDTRREVSFCLVLIGDRSVGSLLTPRESSALALETIPLSQREVEHPAMLEMQDASSLGSEEEVAQWRRKQTVLAPSAPAGEGVQLQRLPEEERPKDTIEQVILRRGSSAIIANPSTTASFFWGKFEQPERKRLLSVFGTGKRTRKLISVTAIQK